MTLQNFSFPFPETRFFKAGSFIYKFKIRGSCGFSGEEAVEGIDFNHEIEDIIRTVLGNLSCLQPFSSSHFNIYPYKKQWEGLATLMCKHSKKKLRVYPFILVLYLEKNTQIETQAEETLSSKETLQDDFCDSEHQSKRFKTESPLEATILQDLIMEDESKVVVLGVANGQKSCLTLSRLHVDNPHAQAGVREDPRHVDKTRMSDVNMITGSATAGEVHPGTTQDMREEDEDENEDVDVDEDEDEIEHTRTSESSGILTRLASHIFPFSLFFKDH